MTRYAAREPTRSEHRGLAIRYLGLRPFLRAEHMRAAILRAARAAFDTDDGRTILQRLATELRRQRFVLPSTVTLERIGLAGRAQARRLAAQAINDALDTHHKRALLEMLEHGPASRSISADTAADTSAFHQCDEQVCETIRARIRYPRTEPSGERKPWPGVTAPQDSHALQRLDQAAAQLRCSRDEITSPTVS